MAFSVGHVLLINGNASLAKLAAAAAMTTHCQLTTVTGVKPALSLVAKKQFDLILVDASSLGDEDLKHLLAIDLTRQGRIVIEGGSGANPKNGSPEYLTEPLSLDGLLSRMSQASVGATPMGVFRAVDRPVYDELMAEQIGVAKAKGEGELAALLGSGDTWTI